MLISIRLRFTGNHLNPDDITAILNVAPCVARHTGDVRITSTNNKIISKFGLWEWKSEPSNTLTINEHIGRLKNTFGHEYELIPNLPNVENAWVDILIVVGDEEEVVSSTSFILDTESISTLHHMGLLAEFTIYVLPQRDKESP